MMCSTILLIIINICTARSCGRLGTTPFQYHWALMEVALSADPSTCWLQALLLSRLKLFTPLCQAVWPVTFSTINHRGHCTLATQSCYVTHKLHQIHQHSFTASAPVVMNNIPAVVCDSISLDTFKTGCYTLFNCAYSPHHWPWHLRFTYRHMALPKQIHFVFYCMLSTEVCCGRIELCCSLYTFLAVRCG